MADLDAPAFVTDRDGVSLGLIVTGHETEPEWETINLGANVRVPDQQWIGAHDDHEHSWAPTSNAEKFTVVGAHREQRHVPCDGFCGGVCDGEGYHVPVWVCDTTGEDVDPGTRPDPQQGMRTLHRSTYIGITVIRDTAREFPRTIENAQIRRKAGDATYYMDLPESMVIGEMTFESGGPTSADYHGTLTPTPNGS